MLLRECFEENEGRDIDGLRLSPKEIEHQRDDPEKQQPEKLWRQKLHASRGSGSPTSQSGAAGKKVEKEFVKRVVRLPSLVVNLPGLT